MQGWPDQRARSNKGRTVSFDFAALVAQLTEDQRLAFYEILAHDLTVVSRSVWSDDALADAAKVERMKWVNEILHRVTAKIRVMRLHSHVWTEEDFGSAIRHWVAQCPDIDVDVQWALRHSHELAQR